MLADRGPVTASSGRLRSDVHVSAEWRLALISFIASELPIWRDDPLRPKASSESGLSAQLCGYLNGAVRLSEGWDFLQFRREEPDEVLSGRAIDLITAPSGVNIWIEGRQYTEYCSLFPIECKRLPTPTGPKRDEREYLHSRHSSTGGIQRFKNGHHGAAHQHAAMIAYIQDRDVPYWVDTMRTWVTELDNDSVSGWTTDDMLQLTSHKTSTGSAQLKSQHCRVGGLDPIHMDHMWVELDS